MVHLFAASLILAAAQGPAKVAGMTCSATRQFVGTAPSDIVQQKYAAHFDQPLNRVDCRDDGLCYQTWGKGCSQANK